MQNEIFKDLEMDAFEAKITVKEIRKILSPGIFATILALVVGSLIAFIINCESNTILNLSQINNKILTSVLLLIIYIISVLLYKCCYNLCKLKKVEEFTEKTYETYQAVKKVHNEKDLENRILKSIIKDFLPQIFSVVDDELSRLR